jgi:exopolyphosphatase/guanosine-5'-triphosphate,3'-diphosphate pyrophosphatase
LVHITTVDIGTNTVLALDTVCADNQLQPTSDQMEITRLGEGLDRNGYLSEAAMARTLETLERIGQLIRVRGPDRVGAVATEAVRGARNGAEFLERARRALGHPVEVIDGEREARLSWLATARSLPPPPGGRRTVLDVGGGSTELMIGSAESLERAVSVPIGSVRLTERLLHTDPPTDDEKRALADTIDRALDTAPRPEGDLVGIAGTVTTLCAIHFALPRYVPDLVHGKRMSRAEVESIVERLGHMHADERRRLPGLDPKRADVIYAGGVIVSRVLARSPAPALLVSDRGVRWGLAYEIAESELSSPCH